MRGREPDWELAFLDPAASDLGYWGRLIVPGALAPGLVAGFCLVSAQAMDRDVVQFAIEGW